MVLSNYSWWLTGLLLNCLRVGVVVTHKTREFSIQIPWEDEPAVDKVSKYLCDSKSTISLGLH